MASIYIYLRPRCKQVSCYTRIASSLGSATTLHISKQVGSRQTTYNVGILQYSVLIVQSMLGRRRPREGNRPKVGDKKQKQKNYKYRAIISITVLYCVCVFSSHSFWTSSSLDVQAGVTQEGHTGFLIHLLSAVRALLFLAGRIQPFLSLVDREVEFCVLTI